MLRKLVAMATLFGFVLVVGCGDGAATKPTTPAKPADKGSTPKPVAPADKK